MQPLKKKKKHPSNEDAKKERHIVTWTQEEDDILREQISIHGTENWTIIASKFKDKTTRQCRRRWYTYLNSDFKKGGWSPEEDLLLCEAQKIFGNRWTEIAKVVSGRTDNAVKNRFSTLCKKKAKYEALAKENSSSCTSSNKKRINVLSDITTNEISPTKKLRRSNIYETTETIDFRGRAHEQCKTTIQDHDRAPLTVLAQNAYNLRSLAPQQIKLDGTKVINGAYDVKNEGTFLKKDDPKISALMQQAELLTSLAQKVTTEISDESLENAWKVLQDFLNQGKETDNVRCKIPDIRLDDLKEILEDLRSSNDGSTQSWRQPNLYEDSPGSSDYSIGSALLSQSVGDQLRDSLLQDAEVDLKAHASGVENSPEGEKGAISGENIDQADILSTYRDQLDKDQILPTTLSAEFSSPLQVTPLFRSLTAGIPSPKFSESERSFLMKTLGIESPSPNPCNSSSQPPLCKRAILQSL